MTLLPSISSLKSRCQALAALDLILSPEWEYRRYSFNSKWAEDQQMGSLRDGSGDEWFCLFDATGWVGLKGFGHESRAWREGGMAFSRLLQNQLPSSLAAFAAEAAFRWDETSFVYYRLSEMTPWVRLNSATIFAQAAETGEEALLSLLVNNPDGYAKYATEYFERDVDAALASHIFALQPITEEVVLRLNPETKLSDIEEQLFIEIGYPAQ